MIIDKFNPAVSKSVLLFLAGFVWIIAGTILLYNSYLWLSSKTGYTALPFISFGILFALLIHHLGFLKIVDKNLKRILLMNEKKCIFSFITWKSYITIAIMITGGTLLRHSEIPKLYLAIIYIGIGLALILSSIRYMRFFKQSLQLK